MWQTFCFKTKESYLRINLPWHAPTTPNAYLRASTYVPMCTPRVIDLSSLT
jgi:hypothetical protein